jgi:hypothetical protein
VFGWWGTNSGEAPRMANGVSTVAGVLRGQ